MRRFGAVLLVLGLMSGSIASAAAADPSAGWAGSESASLPCPRADEPVPFLDMAMASWAHRSDIVCIYELGVTNGTSATSYSPLDTVTRQQMASFLARLYEVVTGSPAPVVSVPFEDMITASASHRDDIARIYGLGVTTGTSATTYSPLNAVTREEMASFLARLYEAVTLVPAPLLRVPFEDISEVSSSHRSDISRIYALGVTSGTSATTYSPLDTVTRQQMASFLARLYRAGGVPPRLVEADDLVGTIWLSASELVPGESFTVNLTVTNVADHPVYLEDRDDLVYLAARLTEEGKETAFGGYVWLGDRVLAPGDSHTMSRPVPPIVTGTGTELEVVAVIAFSLDSFNRVMATGAVLTGVPAIFVPVADVSTDP